MIAVVPLLHVEDAFGLNPEQAQWDAQVREVHLTAVDGNRLHIGQR